MVDLLVREDWRVELKLPKKIPTYLHRTDSPYYGIERELIYDLITGKVEKKDAWLWTASRDPDGYGHFSRFGRREPNEKAHKVAYIINSGEEIPNGLHVLHKCDNPPCVRPSHLWLGTHMENMQDMIKKGRDNYRGLK